MGVEGYRTYVGLLFTGFLLLQLGVTPVTEAILASAEGDGASDLRALSMAVLNITDQVISATPYSWLYCTTPSTDAVHGAIRRSGQGLWSYW